MKRDATTILIGKTKVRKDPCKDPFAFFSPGSVTEADRSRYIIYEIIGQGRYGVVCRAYDQVEQCTVAIKRVELLANDLDKLYREFAIHRALSDADALNIVALKRIIPPDEMHGTRVKHAYMVLEHMPYVMSRVDTKKLPMNYQRKLLFQLLRATSIFHACGVLHRDMKPSNMLMDDAYRLLVCDFGLSRMTSDADALLEWSDYVTTRVYRAPEVIGKIHGGYTSAMDVWSIGCTFAEMVTGTPLFMGDDSKNQLERIIETIGSPTPDEIASLTLAPMREMLLQKRKRFCSSKLDSLAGFRDDPEALDLLKRLLAFDPRKRITAIDALKHEFFRTPEFIHEVPNPSFLMSINKNVRRVLDPISEEDLGAMSTNVLYTRVMAELNGPRHHDSSTESDESDHRIFT
jgi:serine/threonine protein kinase